MPLKKVTICLLLAVIGSTGFLLTGCGKATPVPAKVGWVQQV